MSSKRLSSLIDYARHEYKLRRDCEIGRTTADPRAVLQLCNERRWRHMLDGLAATLRCSQCGRRPKRDWAGFVESIIYLAQSAGPLVGRFLTDRLWHLFRCNRTFALATCLQVWLKPAIHSSIISDRI